MNNVEANRWRAQEAQVLEESWKETLLEMQLFAAGVEESKCCKTGTKRVLPQTL